ncbi:unnamed protein product, partial [Protopolystoma xenopodis]
MGIFTMVQAYEDEFTELRSCLPTFPYERRLSKIDTLRLAIAYMALLYDILNNMSPFDPSALPVAIGPPRLRRKMAAHPETGRDGGELAKPSEDRPRTGFKQTQTEVAVTRLSSIGA